MVKITVLKRFKRSEVFETSPVTLVEHNDECEVFRDGQELLVGADGKMPNGFCTSAWVSIYPIVRSLALGGDLPWYKEKGVAINCCIDGLRPVVFKLERI